MSTKFAYYSSLRDKGLMDEQSYFNLSMSEYQKNPSTFTEEQVGQMESFAKAQGVEFKRDLEDDENKIVGAINQLTSGVVEGFTTFGWADDPKTQTEAMMNKIGHLIGFAPDIIAGFFTFGTSLGASAAKQGAFRAARLAAARKVEDALVYGGKKIPILATERNGKMQLRSVPMKAADWVIAQGKNKLGSSEVLRNSFIGKKVSGLDPKFLNIMEQSAHLSMAMAVSSRKEGPEGWAQAAIHGAAAGAVFGGISNYVNIGKAIASKNPAKINFGHAKIREAADKIFKDLNVAKLEGGISKDTATMIDMGVRGTMGAAFTGGQSTLQEASTPDQVYEYLLGFFFGAAGRPVHEIKATQFIGKNMDKINKFKKDKDGNFVWEPNEIKKIEGFDKESKQTQEYLETFQADYILETMTNRPEDLVDTFFSSLSSVLQGKGKKGQKVLTKREAIKQALDNNAKIKGKVKITAEQVSQMDLDRVKSRPDVDIENVKKGDTIEAFDSATGVPVLAKVSSVTKNGEIRLKRVGETKSTVLDQGTLVSKNIFNPNYKVPANKGISEKYHGKLINELSTKELEALEKEISSMITPELVNMGDSFKAYKKIKAKIEEKGGDVGPQDIFNILNLSHAHKVAALSKLRSKKDLTASEQAALDAITNKGKENGVEKDIKNNRESDKEAGSENIDPFESLMEGVKKDFPDLNARLSDKYQVYKSAAKNARNFEEYLKAVQAINKEIGFNPEKAYSKSKLKAYRTKLIKDWNANSQKIIKQGLTIEVVKEGWKTKDIKIKITRSVDDVGKPLKSETTIDYYNKFYNKKDGLFEISIEYAEQTGTAKLQGEIKMDSFLPRQEAWQAIGPYADIGKAIYDSGAIIMQRGGVDIVQHNPYLHHTNPKTQQAKIRSLAQKDKAAEGGEVPKPIRKDLKDWLKADKDFRKYLTNYKTRFGTDETHYKSNNERFYNELLSNVIYELRDAGLISLSNADINLKTVKRAFDKYVKDGMNSYSSIAKYMQYRKVFDNPQARALEIKYGKNGKLNTLIVNDSSELFQNAFNSGEINPDGVKFYRWKLHDAILKNQGRDGDRSNDYIKDILIQAPDFANRRGLLLNKSAAQRPDKELNAFMEAKNIDVIIMESGRKSNSRHPMVQLDYKNGIYSSKNSLRNSIFEIDQESIRLIDSEYDVMDSSLGFEFMPVQSILKRNMNMGKPLNDAITKMIEESRRGDKSYMEDYSKALVDYQVSLLADPNARLKVNNKSLDINRVDIETILDVMNNQINSPLAKEFMEAMFRDHKNIRNEISDSAGDALDISVKGVNELLAGFNYDPIVLTLGNNMSLFEASFRKHIINRLTRPRSNSAFSFTRMKALTPSVAKMLGKDLKDNNFYLYEGHRDKKITFRNEYKGDTAPKTLGEAFELYQTLSKQSPTKNKTEIMNQIKEEILDMIVIRNPVSAPSGINSLTLGGFIEGSQGRGIIVSRKTAEKLGGADYDGDAVAIYNNVPKDFKKGFADPKVADGLDALIKGGGLTDAGHNVGWGFEQRVKGREAGIKDVFNPQERLEQAVSNAMVSKNIGKVTNFNQDIHDYMNYVTQSGEKGWRLDLDGNMFLKTKKVHERVNSKGEKIKNNRSGKKEWTAQDHLDYFNDYAAPLLLNLTLDGMKNSKNPDLVHLKQQVFNEHFEITNAKGEVLMLATPENKARKDGHLAILPYLRSNKKQLDLDALTSQRINKKIKDKDGNEQILDLDWAHKQKNPENEQSNWLSERFFPSKGTDARLSTILRSDMYHGKVFSVKAYINALTPVEWIMAKMQDRTVETMTEAMAKRLLDGKSVKIWSVDVLDKSKKVQRDYTLTDKDKKSMEKQKGTTPTRDIEFKGLNDKGELTGRLLDGLQQEVTIPRKDIIHLDIEHTFFNALEARKDFKSAVNPKAKGQHLNEIGDKGDIFLTQMTKDSGVADVYLNDSLTDIANGLRIGMFREASMHINPEIFPSSNLPTLFSNLLKGLKNSKNSPVLSKLRENGVLSPEVESWIKITELIEQSGMSTDKAVEVFNMIDSIAPDLMNAAQKSQAIAYQAASAASAIRLELMASRLLDQGKKGNLIDEGFSKKQIEDKLTEIINTSWMIKASDLAKSKSGKELPQNDFNIHEAIKRYKEDYLPYMGEKRLKNKKHIDAFEEIFSHMMLSNISAGKQKIESFYKNMNQELNFGFGKESESPLGKLDLTSRKVKVFNRDTQKNEYKTLPEAMEMYAKQPNHIENRLNELKAMMNNGRLSSNNASAVDVFKRLISSTRMTMLERPNLLKSDSIPLIHKQNFMKGLRDMVDYGMVKNLKSPEGREAIVIEVDRTPIEFESAVKKALKGADSSLFIPRDVRISKEQIVNNVSYDKNGKPIIKKVSKPDPKKEVFITDAEGIDFVAAVIKNQKSNISLNQNIKDSIVSYVNQLSPEQRVKWLDRKGSTPLNIVDLTRDIDLSNSVINEVQLEQLKRFIDIVDKNPRIAETVEGLFAQFGVDIGITGRPYVGKTIQLMNGNDLRMFNNMLEDLYLKPTNMYQKFKKWTTERRIKVEKGKKIERPKNWLDKAYFYFFTEHVGKKYLEPREMLEHQVQEQIIEDVIEGKVVIGKRTYVAPTNSIELVRRQVDESRKFSAAFQDFFQKDLKERFRELDVEGPLKDYMDEMMEIAVDYRVYDNGEFGGRKNFYKKESRDMFEESFNRSKKRLEEITKEHSTFEIKDIASGAGKRKNITPEDLVKLLNNKITDTYQMFVDQLITKGMELDSNGKEYKFTKKTLDDVMHTYTDKDGNRYQFIDYKKINKRYKTQQHGITDIVEALMAPKGSKKSGNLIGMNELLMYRYEYELLNYVKEKFPEFDPAREATHTKEILNFVKSFRKALPMESSLMSLITKNGKADPYWHFQGHLDFSKNRTNIDAWIERSIKSEQVNISKMSKEQFGRKYRVLLDGEVINPETKRVWTIHEVRKLMLSDYAKGLGQSLQRFQQEGAGWSDSMATFVQGHRPAIGGTRVGAQMARSQNVMPGYAKSKDVLEIYAKNMTKAYTDNLAGLRGTMVIDKFIETNAIKDIDHTMAWSNWMRDQLQTMLNLPTFRSLDINGIKKSEVKVLNDFINLKLEKKDKLPYKHRRFLQLVEDHIAPDYHWYETVGRELKGKELRDAIQEYRMERAIELSNSKNINKIKRFGTLYNFTSDESAVNFLRTQEERIGRLFGYEQGQFSMFKELRGPKTAEKGPGGIEIKVSEEARRIALARKVKAWSNLEGKFEMLSLLFHPKTMLANFYGGGTNIYADTGWEHFKNSMSEKYLLNEVFGDATFKHSFINPKTGKRKTENRPFNNMRDIEAWLAKEGMLEGMYLEEAGINKNFQTANQRKFAKEVIKKIFGRINENPDLANNASELEKVRNGTILELAEKYNIDDAVMKFGSYFMRTSEIKLRRTAALAHYLNARRAFEPLTSELAFDSPVLLEVARRGIIASQYVYHSAFRTAYSNTSLGRVMTRFHPYAWNSVKRRRHLYKQGKYSDWFNQTNATEVAQRQLTADMMSMAMAVIYAGTLFEYALSPPMSWMQDTSQWLFGDAQDRERAFFSQWPTTAAAPLQIVTPPIARFVLPPLKSLMTNDWDNFVQFNLATYAPGGRMIRDIYRTQKNPEMAVDFLTGIPIHRIGQKVKKDRAERIAQNEEIEE